VEKKTGSLRASVDANAFEAEIRNAMGEALGCGGHIADEHLQKIEAALAPMYQTLPKNSNGRLDRRSLRHLAHRYFNQKSSLVVRGFEPSRPVSESSWGSAEILSQRVPGYVESVLESRHVQERGFDIKDAAFMIVTIEQLIFDAESSLLEQVYKRHSKPLQLPLGEAGLKVVLEDYLVHWLMGDDQEGINILLANRSLLWESFPHWEMLVSFAEGEVKALQYERQNTPALASHSHGHAGGNALKPQYSFDDAHAVVGDFTKSFASFWESECMEMKESLVSMDPHGTGRVPLSKFYGTGLDSEWRFGESESYLRELGALDETSSWGKQVIIPNYIQAASNCIVTTSHYMVCCANDCLPILSDIEEAIGAPSAEVSQLLSFVRNMTSFEDEAVTVDATLTAQLESIANSHGGEVPIHSRLFMQWLHYVFPRECAFPHKTGTVASVAPLEYNGNYIATTAEMKAHSEQANAVDNTTDLNATAAKEELEWMSQWSEDEELLAGYEMLGKSSSWLSRVSCILFLGACLLGFVGFNRKMGGKADFLLPTHHKAHFV